MLKLKSAFILTVLAQMFLVNTAYSGVPKMLLKNASEKPVYSNLPQFYSSNPDWDKFANEWFMRHLSVDDRSIYTGGVKIGILDVLWVLEWDYWMLSWIDRGAMGTLRQGNNPNDVMLTSLMDCSVDKYGYTLGAKLWYEPKNVFGGWVPSFCWPWPKYNRNYTTNTPTGWDFNDLADMGRDGWDAKDVKLEPGYVDHSLAGTITGSNPEILSPHFDTDVFQVPVIELDVQYDSPNGAGADKLVNGLKIYWTTNKNKEFSEERMVTTAFSCLPPDEYPQDYEGHVSGSQARYPLFFPMYLHPEWGREGRHITRLKIVPAGGEAEGVKVSFNYVRCSYDVRLTTTNSTLINATHKLYMWNPNDEFLAYQMPRLRKAMLFLNEHIRGKKDYLLNWGWMAGKDGIGGECGHGVYGSYWDLLPAGLYDLDSCLAYYRALIGMSELEKACERRGIKVPDVQVLGPDNKTTISYNETPKSLASLAKKVKAEIEKRFWNTDKGRFVRNIDINGKQHDYGYVHFNLLALAWGVGTPEQRDSIVSWVNGSRIIDGDTSTGKDIYSWRFGPRTSTVRNENYYYWAWPHDRQAQPDLYQFEWGNQMQDGGGVPFTSLFDLMSRCNTGRQSAVDNAYSRTLEIMDWYNDVKAAGGKAENFYRAYYDGHPERGYQQSPKPGGIGLDHEFLSDASLGTAFIPFAFLGVDSAEDGILDIAPVLPKQLDKLGCANIFYRGNYITIEVGKDYVSLYGSRITNADGLKLRLKLRNLPLNFKIAIDGRQFMDYKKNSDGSIVLLTDLRPQKIEIN